MTSFENIKIKLSTKERIFQNKNADKVSKSEISPPKCFYHPQDQIIFFCKNPRCTLPLCQKCLNIHRMQHLNRKQIPMQNVITFKQCKEFILTQLKQNQSTVKSNHKAFQVQLTKYKQKLFDTIEQILKKLKDQLYALDHGNSLLKLKEISQSMQKISNENSLTDIIKCYELYYQKKGQNQKNFQNIQKQLNQERKSSIIDHIKLVVDEKKLGKLIERGFLNCKFVREDIRIQTERKSENKTKITRQQYLLEQNDSPKKQSNQLSIKTPINKLDESQNTIERQINKNNQHVSWQQIVTTNQFPYAQTEPIINVKRQQRPSIFKERNQKEKQNKPIVSRSLQFNDFSSTHFKKQQKTQQLFSDVKKYKFDDEEDKQSVKKNSNIYTQNLRFQSYTTPVETPIVSRTRSNSSIKSRGKGISLTKPQPLQQLDHYRQKIKQTVNKMKLRLKSETNFRDPGQVSFSRQNSSDWKRVVNLTDSKVSSSRQSQTSNKRSNIYMVKNQPCFNNQIQQGVQYYKGIDSADVLNPMQMRQLLMKKKAFSKNIESVPTFF